MSNVMNKEQVIAITIDVLENIDVPTKLKEQITDHIYGAVQNLRLVLEMIAKEKEAAQEDFRALPAQDGEDDAGEATVPEVIADEPEADAE